MPAAARSGRRRVVAVTLSISATIDEAPTRSPLTAMDTHRIERLSGSRSSAPACNRRASGGNQRNQPAARCINGTHSRLAGVAQRK